MKTPDLSFFMPLLNVELITTTYYISTITTVCLLIINVKNQKITINALSLELFVILLLNISFAVFPLLVSFTIYFIFLHSLKVLDDEFNFLKTRKKYSLKGFIKQLLPNTIASIIGTVILVAGTYLKIIDLSYGFIMMIIISSVTFPHAFVMNIFYDNLGSNQPS
jgi:Brp/Blh family beta-carotene 15,15'-monooxygenase